MPIGAVLEVFAALEGAPRPAEGKYTGSVILVDLPGEFPSPGRLEPFRLAGIPIVALIRSPNRRDAALRAGFDDYLLRPYASEEIKTRLERLAPAGGAAPSASPPVLERERQAAVGRLTSYFCHAVNNSMQTIRGAIDLAREEPGLSPGIDEYLAICRKETELIGIRINRLRQIYRPEASAPEALQLEMLVRESLKMAADDLLRHNIAVRERIESPLPSISCSADRISLAILMILFYLSDDLGTRGGGELLVEAAQDRSQMLLTLIAIPGTGEAGADHPGALPPGLEPAAELIRLERGWLEASPNAVGYKVQIRFPAGGG
ncbi:MAG: hypothetical protein JW748_01315 [Anaerolineales bacterium]|nr:hypothetical protein [Anaerolineales bacterium]